MRVIRFRFDSTSDISNDTIILAARRKWVTIGAKIDEVKRKHKEQVDQCLAMDAYAAVSAVTYAAMLQIGTLEAQRLHLHPEDL